MLNHILASSSLFRATDGCFYVYDLYKGERVLRVSGLLQGLLTWSLECNLYFFSLLTFMLRDNID